MTKKPKQRSLADDDTDPTATTDEDVPDVPFEAAIEELETIVHELEEGELSLDEAMGRFERGLLLVKTCRAKLEQAELRVSELLEDGTTEPMEE